MNGQNIRIRLKAFDHRILDASTIAVFHCMECDHMSKYKWNKTKRRFVLLPPDPDE